MSAQALLAEVLALQARIRDQVVAACERDSAHALAAVDGEDADGDTIFAIDRVGEALLVDGLAEAARAHGGIRLVAEGIDPAGVVLPHGADPAGVRWRVIVDPIDGTRGLMYQKRPAWILAGIAPERGPATGLHDIVAAAMTEIPLVKQHLSDRLWAVRGAGVRAERCDRLSGRVQAFAPRPSGATSVAQGFAQIARFFPGARDVLGAIDDALMRELLGPPKPGKAPCFEDQYICTGGQLAELILGHDRFTADLRAHLQDLLRAGGHPSGLCCHPYDLCTELIAREAGVVVAGPDDRPLTAPLWCAPDVSWCGYANAALHRDIAPRLRRLLAERGIACA